MLKKTFTHLTGTFTSVAAPLLSTLTHLSAFYTTLCDTCCYEYKKTEFFQEMLAIKSNNLNPLTPTVARWVQL